MAKHFTDEEVERYSRQIILPQVGGVGQRKLRGARIFIIGAGGLGSPVIQYLAAAGAGTIEVIDADVVELNNLHRQVLHATPRLGMAKVDSAREAVAALNPEVNVITHRERLTRENAMTLLAKADVVVEGSDNFPTRFLVNDACHLLRKPLVSGAMFRFEGQVTLFPNDGAANSPCYRCLFPEAPPPGLIPTCQEAGILGALPGVIGSLQAMEVLKLLLGIGESLVGRLLLYDALTMKFREIKLRRDPECALNGDSPTIRELGQYEEAPACER